MFATTHQDRSPTRTLTPNDFKKMDDQLRERNRDVALYMEYISDTYGQEALEAATNHVLLNRKPHVSSGPAKGK